MEQIQVFTHKGSVPVLVCFCSGVFRVVVVTRSDAASQPA